MRYRFLRDATQIIFDESGTQYEPIQRISTKRTKTDTQHNINQQIEYVII